MKNLFIFSLVLSVLMISLLTGCDTQAPKTQTANPKQQTQSDAGTQENQSPTGESKLLTEEEAVAVALNHAELTKEQVTRLHAEYDLDDGVPTWEVDFEHDRIEYEYEIHAETGEILSYDADYD